jgi:hypothetical protein
MQFVGGHCLFTSILQDASVLRVLSNIGLRFVYPWVWPVSLRMLWFVRLNEIRQRRKRIDRTLRCVCSVIKEYAYGDSGWESYHSEFWLLLQVPE